MLNYRLVEIQRRHKIKYATYNKRHWHPSPKHPQGFKRMSGDVETIYLYSASAGLFYESGYKPVLLPEQ